jgi:serine phosphatase RsbU (regulator of sigma subunit)/pSer/pThr/pTyr-binding forkhead associated (FHA) protein
MAIGREPGRQAGDDQISKGAESRSATLVVVNPSGNRSRIPIEPLPFLIGRNAENDLVLRDNRISRTHARVTRENGDYIIEDAKSRHGVWVNGERIERQVLRNADRIEFGFADSYKLTFSIEERQLTRILEQLQPSSKSVAATSSNLGKLRALVEVARALQSSLSTQDVLTSVVDAALAVTSTERGFLILKRGVELDVAVARDRRGSPLAKDDLKVPMTVINRALNQRRELLSMSFDPFDEQGVRPETSVANLELRSVVCVPLIRVRTGNPEETSMLSAASETVGLLYMDSRRAAADLSQGNRELLQTLALEASTILENARLLEEEREKLRLEEELGIARQIQMSLLPAELPSTGWFRASGWSLPSHQVGGDYFDVRQVNAEAWFTVVADVSGKGVSSALLAALLQGAFLLATEIPEQIREAMVRVNRYLIERTKGEKYATIFYATVNVSGVLQWANAGHCAPLLVHSDGRLRTLQTTGLPLGMLENAEYFVERVQLEPGDKVVIYSDGLTEAESPDGRFFGSEHLRELVQSRASEGCGALRETLLAAVKQHTAGTLPSDDVTLVVIEFAGHNSTT